MAKVRKYCHQLTLLLQGVMLDSVRLRTRYQHTKQEGGFSQKGS